MNTTENNKLFAEFIGLKDPMNNGIWIDSLKCRAFYTEELEYHTSWDWLMPVVEKINTTFLLTEVKPAFYVTINFGWCYIGQDNQHSIAFKDEIEFEDIDICEESTLLAVYTAVLEFIKWYNENKN